MKRLFSAAALMLLLLTCTKNGNNTNPSVMCSVCVTAYCISIAYDLRQLVYV